MKWGTRAEAWNRDQARIPAMTRNLNLGLSLGPKRVLLLTFLLIEPEARVIRSGPLLLTVSSLFILKMA